VASMCEMISRCERLMLWKAEERRLGVWSMYTCSRAQKGVCEMM
jgi:hypothetical protein